MDLLGAHDVSSVTLFDLRVSEGEVQYLAVALQYVLKHVSPAELHRLFAESDPDVTPLEVREFLESLAQDLKVAMRKHGDPDFLPTQVGGSVKMPA